MHETSLSVEKQPTGGLAPVGRISALEIFSGGKTAKAIWELSTRIAGSAFAPKAFRRPEDIFLAITFGAEIGLPPMLSLRTIAVVNGTPSVFGDAVPALIMRSGLLEGGIQVCFEGTPYEPEFACVVRMQRRGTDYLHEERWTVADEIAAGLLPKGYPGNQTGGRDTHKQHPKAMMRRRCLMHAARVVFPDVISGLYSFDEAEEIIDVAPKVVSQEPGAEGLKARLQAAKADASDMAPPPADPPVENGIQSPVVVLEGDRELFIGEKDGKYSTFYRNEEGELTKRRSSDLPYRDGSLSAATDLLQFAEAGGLKITYVVQELENVTQDLRDLAEKKNEAEPTPEEAGEEDSSGNRIVEPEDDEPFIPDVTHSEEEGQMDLVDVAAPYVSDDWISYAHDTFDGHPDLKVAFVLLLKSAKAAGMDEKTLASRLHAEGARVVRDELGIKPFEIELVRQAGDLLKSVPR